MDILFEVLGPVAERWMLLKTMDTRMLFSFLFPYHRRRRRKRRRSKEDKGRVEREGQREEMKEERERNDNGISNLVSSIDIPDKSLKNA